MRKVDYKCNKCCRQTEKIVEDTGLIPDNLDCECGGKLVWFHILYDYVPPKEYGKCRVDELMAEHPRYSDAMGINPDQEPEFRRQFPKLDLTFDREGRLLVKNRVHKKQLMKAFGMTEFDGSSWRNFPRSHCLVDKRHK